MSKPSETSEFLPGIETKQTYVFVDALFTAQSREPQAFAVGQRNGHLWCHMWSEDEEALHQIAQKIGLSRSWFQNKAGFPHYDLTPSRRVKALKAGVVETSLKGWIQQKLRAARKTFPCQKCSLKFPTIGKLAEHVEETHDLPEEP